MSPEKPTFEGAELAKHRGAIKSSQDSHYIAEASECERKAKDALDLSVRRYFIKLARDYRHLAE